MNKVHIPSYEKHHLIVQHVSNGKPQNSCKGSGGS